MNTLDSLKQTRALIEQQLPAIAKQLGISFSLKIEGGAIGKGGVAITKESEALQMYLGMLGLTKADLAKPFTLGGRKFTLTGYNPRASRRCMILTRDDGRAGFVAPQESVLRAMGKGGE